MVVMPLTPSFHGVLSLMHLHASAIASSRYKTKYQWLSFSFTAAVLLRDTGIGFSVPKIWSWYPLLRADMAITKLRLTMKAR